MKKIIPVLLASTFLYAAEIGGGGDLGGPDTPDAPDVQDSPEEEIETSQTEVLPSFYGFMNDTNSYKVLESNIASNSNSEYLVNYEIIGKNFHSQPGLTFIYYNEDNFNELMYLNDQYNIIGSKKANKVSLIKNTLIFD